MRPRHVHNAIANCTEELEFLRGMFRGLVKVFGSTISRDVLARPVSRGELI